MANDTELLEHEADTEVLHDDSPEQVIADMRKQVEAANAAADAAREAQRLADERAAQAGSRVQSAQEQQLDALIVGSEAAIASAENAYIAARESGDVAAEVKAQRALASAQVRHDALSGEKARMARTRAQPQTQPQGQPQPAAGRIPGPAARAWMDDHPKINSDPAYANAAEAAHHRAIASGHEPESPGYFQSINSELTRRFGENHGRDEAVAEPPARRPPLAATLQRQPGPRASSFATPQDRGNSGSRGAPADVQEIARKLNVTRDDVVEAAEYTYPKLDKAEAVKRYCAKQAEILAERNSTITYGDGAVYR